MARQVTVGVLALQGAFAKHIQMLKSIGAHTKEVRVPCDLDDCDALIIPGGESTTILHLAKNIREPLQKFIETKPVFGTCAGLILLAKQIVGHADMLPFKVMDIAVERNAFGRQAESFVANVDIHLGKEKARPFKAFFIRAPRIRHCGEGVKVLASYDDEPILIQQGHLLGATFHPELTHDASIHRYFLSLIK